MLQRFHHTVFTIISAAMHCICSFQTRLNLRFIPNEKRYITVQIDIIPRIQTKQGQIGVFLIVSTSSQHASLLIIDSCWTIYIDISARANLLIRAGNIQLVCLSGIKRSAQTRASRRTLHTQRCTHCGIHRSIHHRIVCIGINVTLLCRIRAAHCTGTHARFHSITLYLTLAGSATFKPCSLRCCFVVRNSSTSMLCIALHHTWHIGRTLDDRI
mmetsp:Transcript_27710/g.43893  ORF Transcript_27710/g.43893 Transcript_27710/m.43893 type:complete len:214 (+) Transcript_27710:24-665(+)